MEGFRRASGFTLIEILIVLGIMAILAAIALPNYSSYLRKAKAKDLVSLSRNCLQELMQQCIQGGSVGNLSSLEACSTENDTILYLKEVSLSFSPSSSADYCQESEVKVSAHGKVDGKEFVATCTYTRADKELHCETARRAP